MKIGMTTTEQIIFLQLYGHDKALYESLQQQTPTQRARYAAATIKNMQTSIDKLSHEEKTLRTLNNDLRQMDLI